MDDLRAATDRAFRFLAGLDLQDQPIAVQREAVELVRQLGRALRPSKVRPATVELDISAPPITATLPASREVRRNCAIIEWYSGPLRKGEIRAVGPLASGTWTLPVGVRAAPFRTTAGVPSDLLRNPPEPTQRGGWAWYTAGEYRVDANESWAVQALEDVSNICLRLGPELLDTVTVGVMAKGERRIVGPLAPGKYETVLVGSTEMPRACAAPTLSQEAAERVRAGTSGAYWIPMGGESKAEQWRFSGQTWLVVEALTDIQRIGIERERK